VLVLRERAGFAGLGVVCWFCGKGCGLLVLQERARCFGLREGSWIGVINDSVRSDQSCGESGGFIGVNRCQGSMILPVVVRFYPEMMRLSRDNDRPFCDFL
jgi:hypothetical protein